MFGRNLLKNLATAAFLAVMAGGAQAALVTTYCPGTEATTDREFTLTIEGPTAAGCVTSGAGNTDSGGNGINALNEAAILLAVSPGSLLDKTDGASLVPGVVLSMTGMGTLSGLWNIVIPTGYELVNAFIALKSGVGQLDPDWALFSLPNGTLSGSWSIASGDQSLSHGSLYGSIVPSIVPVPAAGLLLLGALGGLAALRRRRAV